MAIKIFTHYTYCHFDVFIRGSNKGWEEAGTARFQVGRLHNFERFNGGLVVKHHPTAAV